ncbi:hypothetical protein IFM89_023950 [Coptis chinensis]|uniref:Cytochrome P450 n=1 Tax=Coptis chinensis TaxID=261450 RepID=A0A835LWE0_9MAGN|nr:hypothetical protein IFM89_023950 [Coptis chinensis]
MASLTFLLEWFDLGKQQATLFQHPYALSLLSIFSILILLRLIKRACSINPYLPPSPPKLPFIGNLHQLGKVVHRSLRDLSNQYGPLMLVRLGRAPVLIVSSADMAREIMKTHDVAFANRPFTTAAKIIFYGCTTITFSPYGEYWRHARKVSVTELLSIKRVEAFKFVREDEVGRMIKKISQSSLVGAPINLSNMLLSLSNNVLYRCVLGIRCRDGDVGENKFGELSSEVLKLMGAFSFRDIFPLLGWMDFFTGLDRRIKRVSREIDMLLDKIIVEHLINIKGNDSDDKKDFLDLLLGVQKNNILDIEFTQDNIKAIILDMFLGGTSTTSTTIEWAIAELLKNPNMMKKAQEEVRRVAGKKPEVDEEDIHQMSYLKAVVKETLRLHPPVPLLLPRESSTSTTIKGYYIPSKTTVFINAWAIQRDSEVWKNPEEFIPERFTNTLIDSKGLDYDYMPFGLGRRGCPGMSFGIALVEIVIAKLLYWFNWELPGGVRKEELDLIEASGFNHNKITSLHLVPIPYSS